MKFINESKDKINMLCPYWKIFVELNLKSEIMSWKMQVEVSEPNFYQIEVSVAIYLLIPSSFQKHLKLVQVNNIFTF